ncbi:hypothetical protein [Halocynthiibacter sp.]|uniref:hypothetical protein n=1 Tax=Halocynthiibacter sp. TaxID=1979210 RepID=UPI003C625596
MTDFFKELLEDMRQRIRSPFIGSIIFAFVAINWRALFFLFFADVPVVDRISYYDDHTTFCWSYAFPVGLGIAVAVLMPWLKYYGAWIAKRPATKLYELQTAEARRRRTEHSKFEEEEEEALRRRERRKEEAQIELIEESEGAQVSTEDSVGSTDVQEVVPREIQLARSLDTVSRVIVVVLGLTSEDGLKVDTLYSDEGFQKFLTQTGHEATGVRLEQEYKHAVQSLLRIGIIEVTQVPVRTDPLKRKFDNIGKLSLLGYAVFDAIREDISSVAVDKS